MQDIPALEMPAPYSVLDEFRIVNENDPDINWCRIINNCGHKRDASKMGLNKKGQLAIVRLLLAKEADTYYKSIEDWFDEDFLQSTFYTLWKTMFAFEQWQSLTELKRYMHRFLQYLPGFSDLSCLRFSRYNQYDSFVVPLVRWLTDQGVNFQYESLVYDVDLEITAHRKIARAVLYRDAQGGNHRIEMTPKDLVFVTNGSLTECTGYGDMDHAAPYHKEMEAGWQLWRNLVKRSPVFGRPDVFCADPDKTVWQSISFNFIGRDHPFLKKIKELTGNDPLSGRTVTGGIITAEDSSWCLSLTMNRQPQFHGQPEDWGWLGPTDCTPSRRVTVCTSRCWSAPARNYSRNTATTLACSTSSRRSRLAPRCALPRCPTSQPFSCRAARAIGPRSFPMAASTSPALGSLLKPLTTASSLRRARPAPQ